MAQLGFGFLRLPEKDNDVDYSILNEMVDTFLAGGGTYFDTSHTYMDGKSEEAIRKALVERYPRERFQIATKMPGYRIKSREECEVYFKESAQRCGVDYFDVYMLHWLNAEHYRIAEQYGEFEFLQELKRSGKAKRIGFSFHDTAEVLDEILTAHPEVDCVLLQINYLDWDSPSVQSRLCLETAKRHGKSVIVMEPVKGGSLATVSDAAARVLHQIDPALTPAGHAIRFVKSLNEVEIVLSGMNAMQQLTENLRPMTPVTDTERTLLEQAARIIRGNTAVACTGCGYCKKACPMGIDIPGCFALYNEHMLAPIHMWEILPTYAKIAHQPAQCIACHACEANCPQKLPIPDTMKIIAESLPK